jgi:hypothetical protein
VGKSSFAENAGYYKSEAVKANVDRKSYYTVVKNSVGYYSAQEAAHAPLYTIYNRVLMPSQRNHNKVIFYPDFVVF